MDSADIIKEVGERGRRARVYIDADTFLGRVVPAHLREAAALYLTRGGKGFRPALVMFACGAAGGEEDRALAAAAAAEVTHNWTLIHDDVVDRDEQRRGGPAVHAALATRGMKELGLTMDDARHYGLSLAILGGDVGPCWAAHLLARLPENGKTSAATAYALAARLAAVTVPAILAGEAEDIQLSRAPLAGLSMETIEAMMAKKTGALYEWCAWAGAVVGGANQAAAGHFAAFARLIGTAFQHVDDTLPFVGDEHLTGKPALSDLREGKRTAVVWGAFRNAPLAEQIFISDTLGQGETDEEDLAALKALLRKRGGVDFARARARALYDRALTYLGQLPPTAHRDLLAACAAYLISRDR